jgi:PAS domain S-box-containing protein
VTKKLYNNSNKSTQEEENPYLNDFIFDMPGYVYVKDKNGVYLAANKFFLQIAGLKSLSELLGKTDRDLPWKERNVEYQKNDEYVMETGESIDCEEVVKTSDGETRIFITEKKPLKDRNGNIIGVIGNSLDITENKKIYTLQKNQEVTEKTIKFMEMLVSNIAHELRTPQAIIKLNIDLLEHSYSLKNLSENEKEKILLKTLAVIKNVIQAHTYILDNILVTLKNLVRGKIDHKDFVRLSISENIEDALAHFPFEEDERELVEWRKVEDFQYIGEDLLTRHVLFNLLKNSLWAIKEASKGKITIELKKNKDCNKLIFKDTALGIPIDYLPKIFNRFASAEPSKTGLGLGLPFCKMIMQAYGGDITCNSEEGKFAEFVLSFPAIER